MIAVSSFELEIILKIIKKHVSRCDVLAFGSRYKWTNEETSDLDLAIIGYDKVGYSIIDNMKFDFMESDLPFRVDVLDYNAVSSEFRAIIDGGNEVIYRGGSVNCKSGWKPCSLGDIITFQIGHDLPKAKMSSGEYPVVGSNGIMGYHDKYTTEEPSVTIGRSGNVGNPFIVYNRSWSHNTTFYIKEYKNADPVFIYYLLKTIDFRNFAGGSAVPTLSRNHIHALPVETPPLAEQIEIGRTLRVLDDKISNNTKINRHLEQMAQAIFKSWFVDFEPFSGGMPDDWQAVTLGELCDTVTKGTTPTTLKKQFVAQGINFVKAESILDDHSIDFEKLAFIDDETNALLSRSVIHRKDIMFTIAETLGRFAFACADLLPANTNQAVAIIRADSSKINPETLYSFLIGGLHSDFYTKNIQQAVQANLSLTTIEALPLLLPPTETLSEYSALIEPLFGQIFQNNAENRMLATLRDTILPRFMSGELSIADL